MNNTIWGKITEIDSFNFLDCYSKRPLSVKKIFKVMAKSDFELSQKNNYLHFNRVDSYPDKNDGLQLILDSIGNKNTRKKT